MIKYWLHQRTIDNCENINRISENINLINSPVGHVYLGGVSIHWASTILLLMDTIANKNDIMPEI